MNATLERFTRINKSKLSRGSDLEPVQEGNYLFFQTIVRKQGQALLRLFAVDIDQQKLVLDMLATESKSPHRKIPIGAVQSFFTCHDVQGDSSWDYLYAVTKDGEELEVSSRYSQSTRDLEEMAMVLAVICNKALSRYSKSIGMTPVDTSELLS